MKILFVLREVDDRVTDQLARPVVGDVTAALHFVELDAAGCQSFGRFDHVGVLGPTAEGNHAGVLEQDQEVVGQLSLDPRSRQPAL